MTNNRPAGARASIQTWIMITTMAAASIGAAQAGGALAADPSSAVPSEDLPVALAVALCEDDGPPVTTRILPQGLRLTVSATCAEEEGSRSDVAPLACSSTAYAHLGFRWYEYPQFFYDPAGRPSSDYSPVTIRNSYGDWGRHTPLFTVAPAVPAVGLAEPGQLDGINQVAWRTIGGNTLGYAATWWWNGIALDADVVFDSTKPWDTAVHASSGTYSWPTVVKHELGHAFGLDHVSTDSANRCLVMYPYIYSGSPYNPSLATGDILGIQALYGTI